MADELLTHYPKEFRRAYLFVAKAAIGQMIPEVAVFCVAAQLAFDGDRAALKRVLEIALAAEQIRDARSRTITKLERAVVSGMLILAEQLCARVERAESEATKEN